MHDTTVMENESSVVRLRRKLSELSNEYSKDKQAQQRSKSAAGRLSSTDSNASLRYKKMRRKVDLLRTNLDAAMQADYLTKPEPTLRKDMIPTRDDTPLKKKTISMCDEQNLVTGELVQVLHSKQTRIDELERRLKDMDQQESQWKLRYERECVRCETLHARIVELEKELMNRQRQSQVLGQLQTDVKRLHLAFDALETENTQLNAQLSLTRRPPHPPSSRLSAQLDKFRHELAQTCHESLC